MANHREKLSFSRSRMRLRQRRMLLMGAGIGVAALVLIIVLAVLLSGGKGKRDNAVTAAAPTQAVQLAEAADVEAVDAEAEDADLEETYDEADTEGAFDGEDAEGAFDDGEDAGFDIEPEATPSPASAGDDPVAAARAQTRPTPTAEGFAPVFTEAKTSEKIVAITVDDCFQAENLRQIVDTALSVGGKLTIFPIGKNVMKKNVGEVLKYAYEHGCELEDHTYNHNGLFSCSDARLAKEVTMQRLALCQLLGVEYQTHFLRPRGGDARNDQRMQQYVLQNGMYGIAHWSASGGSSREVIAKKLKPGAIYLFHCTNNDLSKLKDFIPWVASKGYQLVTLNEMFGYPENETSPLTTAPKDHPVPPLQPYERVYTTLKKTTYSYYAYLLQAKLIELGYLTGKPDGVYGEGCAAAVSKYQKDHGLEVTGKADPALQKELIG